MIHRMADGYFPDKKPSSFPLVPDLEEMTYRSLLKLTFLMDETDSGHDIPSCLSDIIHLNKKKPDTALVLELAKKEHGQVRLKAALDYFKSLLPEYELPGYDMECCSQEEWGKYLRKRKYIEEVLRPARLQKRAYPLKRLKEEPQSILLWMRARVRYTAARLWGKFI